MNKYTKPDHFINPKKLKDMQREELARLTAEFLASGKTIQPAEEMPDPVYKTWPARWHS